MPLDGALKNSVVGDFQLSQRLNSTPRMSIKAVHEERAFDVRIFSAFGILDAMIGSQNLHRMAARAQRVDDGMTN